MCYLGDCWITVDGKEMWELFFVKSITGPHGILAPLANEIFERREHWVDDLEWKHEMQSHCSWGKVAMRNEV